MNYFKGSSYDQISIINHQIFIIMKLQELNIQELENRFEMSAAAEGPSIKIGEFVIYV